MLVYSSLLSCLLLLRVLRFSFCLSLYWCCIHIDIICAYLGHYVTAHSHTHTQAGIYTYVFEDISLYLHSLFALLDSTVYSNGARTQQIQDLCTTSIEIYSPMIHRESCITGYSLTSSIHLLAYLNPRNRIVNTFKVLKVDKVTRIFYHSWDLSQSAL